jgi:hypothetical protein
MKDDPQAQSNKIISFFNYIYFIIEIYKIMS